MRRTLAVVALLLATAALAGTISIPEPIKVARPGISLEAHKQCVEWWEDWAAQNKAALEKMDALEQHCAFVHYMQQCGSESEALERPGTPPGARVPSFTDFTLWDNSMADLFQDRCFEFTYTEGDALDGIVKGDTKRLLKLVNDDSSQLDHIRRRTGGQRKVSSAVFPGLGRPMSKQEAYRRTGTR